MVNSVIIIGASHSGVALAASLRELNYTGNVILIERHEHLPYQRPPLSKNYLKSSIDFSNTLLRPAEWYKINNISVISGISVIGIDCRNHSVSLSDGRILSYDKLALTTGASARPIDNIIGGNLNGIYTLRNKEDCDSLKSSLRSVKKCLVIGGGYIGLEFASVARQLNIDVTIIERTERVLSRVASPETSSYFSQLHKKNGVEIIEGAGVAKFIGKNGFLKGVQLTDGTQILGDIAVAAIGIVPADDLAREAGLDVSDGIIVNAFCETSSDNVVAAGDCTRFLWEGEWVRLESVQNAVDQAQHAAATIMGRRQPYNPKPWFWSDQFNVKLQIAGLSLKYTKSYTRIGKTSGRLSVWYYKDRRLIAVDAINDPSSYICGKKALESNIPIDPHDIENIEFDIMEYIKNYKQIN